MSKEHGIKLQKEMRDPEKKYHKLLSPAAGIPYLHNKTNNWVTFCNLTD